MSGTDVQLLDQFLRNRDEAAFQQMVERHVPMVLSLARRVVRDEEMARDVCQQTFIRLASKASSVRAEAGVAAWLHVTTRSLALDAVRSEKRRKLRELKAHDPMDHDRSNQDAAWRDLAPALDELLEKLPAADRALVLLRYYQGRPLSSVAAELGIPENTVSKRTSRALERLRKLFARKGIATSASALASMLPSHAAVLERAPEGFATQVGTAALAFAPPVAAAAVSTGTAGYLTTVLAMTTTTKITLSATAVLILAAAATYTATRPEPSTSAAGQIATGGNTRSADPSSARSPKDAISSVTTKRSNRPDAPPGPPNLRLKPDAVSTMLRKQLEDFNFSVNSDMLGEDVSKMFEENGYKKVTEALALVGATQTESEEVVSILKQARTDLLAAEKQHIKAVKSDSTGVTLDLGGMKESVDAAIAKSQQALRKAVPSDLSDPLVNAIDWDGFYFQSGGTEARLRVTRGKDGGISSSFSSGNIGTSTSIADRFHDDGTPIPADQLFGPRWAPFLKGVELLPVDED